LYTEYEKKIKLLSLTGNFELCVDLVIHTQQLDDIDSMPILIVSECVDYFNKKNRRGIDFFLTKTLKDSFGDFSEFEYINIDIDKSTFVVRFSSLVEGSKMNVITGYFENSYFVSLIYDDHLNKDKALKSFKNVVNNLNDYL